MTSRHIKPLKCSSNKIVGKESVREKKREREREGKKPQPTHTHTHTHTHTNTEREREGELAKFSMMGFDSATSSFLALLVIKSHRKN